MVTSMTTWHDLLVDPDSLRSGDRVLSHTFAESVERLGYDPAEIVCTDLAVTVSRVSRLWVWVIDQTGAPIQYDRRHRFLRREDVECASRL